MSTCSTWHVRIDIVDDGTTLTARASLIGAPTSNRRQSATHPHLECLTEGGSATPLGEWQPLGELAVDLVDALGCEHSAHTCANVPAAAMATPKQ